MKIVTALGEPEITIKLQSKGINIINQEIDRIIANVCIYKGKK